MDKELVGMGVMISLLIFALLVPGGGILAMPIVITAPFLFFL